MLRWIFMALLTFGLALAATGHCIDPSPAKATTMEAGMDHSRHGRPAPAPAADRADAVCIGCAVPIVAPAMSVTPLCTLELRVSAMRPVLIGVVLGPDTPPPRS